jgi:acetyl-CoA carboxylase carboxyltransferase component
MHEVIARVVDGGKFEEYRAEYGKTVLCGYARIGGWAVGIVANNKKHVTTIDAATGERRIEFGGVIYTESAEKAARFIMDCNQNLVPLIFLHDVNGFAVGKEAKWSDHSRGRKMVNAVPQVVPDCGDSRRKFRRGHTRWGRRWIRDFFSADGQCAPG